MAYNKDDMTYAVVKFAEEHPEIKLTWTAIVDWIHDGGADNDFRLARLMGVKDYHFYRPRKVDGKETYLECKIRFDEINQLRDEIRKAKLPDFLSVKPEQFVLLPYSEQIKAVLELQKAYKELRAKLGIEREKDRKNKEDLNYVLDLGNRVETLEESVQKTVKRTEEQMAHIMRLLNETQVIGLLEEYQIPLDTPDHVKIMDFLDDDLARIHDIRVEIDSFVRIREANDEEGDKVTADNTLVASSKEEQYWNRKTAALFDDDEEDDDTE